MQSPELRKHFRQLRRTLTEARQHSNAIQLGHLLDQHIGRRTGQRIAAYLAVQGEISLTTGESVDEFINIFGRL